MKLSAESFSEKPKTSRKFSTRKRRLFDYSSLTEYARQRRREHPEKVRAIYEKAEHKRRLTPQGWAKLLVYGARSRAKKQKLSMQITATDVLRVWPSDNRCPVLGMPFAFGRNTGGRMKRDAAPSLDRIDPKKGYVPGNIAVISWRANLLKRDATADEIKRLAAWIKKNFSVDA